MQAPHHLQDKAELKNTPRYFVFWMEDCFGGHLIKIGLYKLILYPFFSPLRYAPTVWESPVPFKIMRSSRSKQKKIQGIAIIVYCRDSLAWVVCQESRKFGVWINWNLGRKIKQKSRID